MEIWDGRREEEKKASLFPLFFEESLPTVFLFTLQKKEPFIRLLPFFHLRMGARAESSQRREERKIKEYCEEQERTKRDCSIFSPFSIQPLFPQISTDFEARERERKDLGIGWV